MAASFSCSKSDMVLRNWLMSRIADTIPSTCSSVVGSPVSKREAVEWSLSGGVTALDFAPALSYIDLPALLPATLPTNSTH